MRLELFTDFGSKVRDAIRIRSDGTINIPNMVLKYFGVKPKTACRIYACDRTKHIAIEFNVKKDAESSRNLNIYEYGGTVSVTAVLKHLGVTLPQKRSVTLEYKTHEDMMLIDVSKMMLNLQVAA